MQSSGAGARTFQNARLQKKLMKQADAVISAAGAAYGQGRYGEAEALCREILKALPEHFDATHLLGLCAHEGRRLEEALARTEGERDEALQDREEKARRPSGTGQGIRGGRGEDPRKKERR